MQRRAVVLFFFLGMALAWPAAAAEAPALLAIVPAVPAAAGGLRIPDPLTAVTADTLGRALAQIAGVTIASPSGVYHASLAVGNEGVTTPEIAAKTAQRLQARLAILVQAAVADQGLTLTGTPALPEAGRGKAPAPFQAAGKLQIDTDRFTILSDFVQAAIKALELKPTAEEQQRINRIVRATASPKAFDLYAEARQQMLLGSLEGYQTAVLRLQEIVLGTGAGNAIPPVDDRFALAHAALAESAALLSMQQALVGLRDNRLKTMAVRAAEAAVKLEPGLPDTHRALALACALVERHRQAEQEAREALRIKPNDPGAHLWLGVALGGDGKAELETALKLDPSLGLGHLFLAVLAAAEGNKEVLAEECRKALALSPADPSPSLLLGMIYTGEGKIDEAVATYKQALIANPRAALAHGALARIYYRRGQKELATDSLKQAFGLDSRIAQMMREQAATYQQAGNWEEAEKEYQLILLGDPNDPESLRGLGTLALDRGRLEDAERYYRQALTVSPKDVWAWIGLSRCHQRQGKDEESLQDLRRAVDLQNEDATVRGAHLERGRAYLALGQAYQQRNRTQEALEAYDKAVELLNTPDAHFLRAQLLETAQPAQAPAAWQAFLDAVEVIGGPKSDRDKERVAYARQRLRRE